MSYENTNCVCGGKKERETLLCAACREHFASTIELAAIDDMRLPWESRRHSAIRLLSMARKRNKRLPLAFLA